MRIFEVFPDHKDMISGGIDAVMNRADDAVKSAKVQKKQADISKAKDNVAKKQKQLTDITKGT